MIQPCEIRNPVVVSCPVLLYHQHRDITPPPESNATLSWEKSLIQAWSSPSFPPMTIEEDKMASAGETPTFCMVEWNKFQSIRRIKCNSVDRMPSGTVWKDQEIMNSKWCVLITDKIEKYILTSGDLHFFWQPFVACHVQNVMFMLYWVSPFCSPKTTLKNVLYFLFLSFDMLCHKSWLSGCVIKPVFL